MSRTLYLAFALVVVFLIACAALNKGKDTKFKKPSHIESTKTSRNGHAYSTRGGQFPQSATPASTPNFQCCESNVRIVDPQQPVARSARDRIGAQPVTMLTVDFQWKINWSCAAIDGKPPCMGTFQEIRARTQPSLRNQATGTNVLPTRHRVWWTESRGKCDGKNYQGIVRVRYIAQYNGHFAIAAAANQLVLDVTSLFGKGMNHSVTANLAEESPGRPTGVIPEGGWSQTEPPEPEGDEEDE